MDRLKSGRYRAPPVRRHYIDKSDGGKRAPSIPILHLRVISMAACPSNLLIMWLPGTDYSAFGLTLRVALAGDRRRCAASSNRLVVCRRFELAANEQFCASGAATIFMKLAPRDGSEIM